MSLRKRLTFLSSTMMGGILLVFGLAVYLLVNYLLLKQVDDMLQAAADDIVGVMQVNSIGELNILSLPPLDINSNVVVQVWDTNGSLKSATSSIGILGEPLDPIGLQAGTNIYNETVLGGSHLRVLSTPLYFGNHPIGVLQVASIMTVVDTARNDLIFILLITAIGAAFLAGLGSWIVIGRALSPLQIITETTDQMNRADDLSRRIPYDGAQEDEMGSLINSFNQTLERLETLFTSQQRFLADVSHELRTPLTVIKGNVDLMRRMKSLDKESLNSIDQEASRLTRMVVGLLLLTQADSGKLPLNMTAVALDELIVEVFQEMRVLAGDKVVIKISEIDQLQVLGDRDRLKQVLLNLVANAIQYTPQDGEIYLSLAKVGDQTRIIVRDTGPGISADDLPHIFERFYRAEKSRTRSKLTGFGLGLSIAQWIIENHNGKITVESKEGKGTTFVIWIPLAV